MGFPWVFPIMLIFFFFLFRGCLVLSHSKRWTDSISEQENKVHFCSFPGMPSGDEICYFVFVSVLSL